MDKLKKMTSYRLFWPIVCLALVLLFNLIKSPSFFEISIKNGYMDIWSIFSTDPVN